MNILMLPSGFHKTDGWSKQSRNEAGGRNDVPSRNRTSTKLLTLAVKFFYSVKLWQALEVQVSKKSRSPFRW